MVKRTQRAAPGPARAKPEAKPALTLEQHSGEGSASALATLQKQEIRRHIGSRTPEPPPPGEPDIN